jgi:hypothetical protein
LKKVFLLLAIALLSACATTSFRSNAPEFTGENRVSSVYVYSFLDLREGALGRKFLAEVKRQLNDSLSRENISSKQLWFNDSPFATQFSLEEKGPNPSNTSTRVPVEEVIKATQDEERLFGASHRLIVFPASVMQSNTGASFGVRWTLVDLKTNQTVWTTTSVSNHAKWFLGDENPEARATTFVEELMSELRKSKAIRERRA